MRERGPCIWFCMKLRPKPVAHTGFRGPLPKLILVAPFTIARDDWLVVIMTRSSRMHMHTIQALVLALAALLIPCFVSAGELTIDGTSQESFEASIREMTEGLSDVDAKAFASGLLNMILTEYPPAKGQDGLSVLFFGEEAAKAAPRTLDGKTRAEIIARGRDLSDNEGAGAGGEEASAQELVQQCLRQAVVVESAEIERGDFSKTLEVTIANHLPWAISGVRFHYEVRTEGRAVPWAEDDVALSIAGGIEAGEVRTVGTSLFSMPSEAREPFLITVTIRDAADQDKRQLIGGQQIIGWDSTPSTRECSTSILVPNSTASNPPEPPLTDAEKEAFRLAIQRCWVVPAGLRGDRGVKVTVGADLTLDGTVVSSSVAVLDQDPAKDPKIQQLFEAVRRAILRCAPYADLRQEKFDEWQHIKIFADTKGIVSWY